MASAKQLAANRANARRSTGSRTALGKARSRMNSCTHGLTAQTIVIGDEDPNEFDVLRERLEEDFQPRSGMEQELVERLAGLMWRLRRIPTFEAALIEARCAEVADTAGRYEDEDQPGKYIGQALIEDATYHDTLGKLSRHEAGLMNAYAKTLHMLLVLQSRRASDNNGDRVVEAIAPPPNGPVASSR